MTKIDIGKVAITLGGFWKPGESYESLVAVVLEEDGNSYVSLAPSMGVKPGTDKSRWEVFALAGRSIYQLAVKQGKFTGTEEEFVDQYYAALQAAKDAAAESVRLTTEALNKAQADLNTMLSGSNQKLQEALDNNATKLQEQMQTNQASVNTFLSKSQETFDSYETNEAIRKKNEGERKTNEAQRISNESARNSDETTRRNSEIQRNQDEQTRKENEETRKSNEVKRQNAVADALADAKASADLADQALADANQAVTNANAATGQATEATSKTNAAIQRADTATANANDAAGEARAAGDYANTEADNLPRRLIVSPTDELPEFPNVRYDAQELTEEQKTRARKNIGAGADVANEYNISYLNGGIKYDLQGAVNALDTYLTERGIEKPVGLKITYVDSVANKAKTYSYQGGSFVSVGSWSDEPLGGYLRKIIEKMGGKLNESTGLWELNGTSNVSQDSIEATLMFFPFWLEGGIANKGIIQALPVITYSTLTMSQTNFNFYSVFRATSLRRINLTEIISSYVSFIKVSQIQDAFRDCLFLEEIVTPLNVAAVPGFGQAFENCEKLVKVKLLSLSLSVSFEDSPLLDVSDDAENGSLAYMIKNRGVKGTQITITLHPTAFSKCSETMKQLAVDNNVILKSA